jgi:hypothetical protein
MGKGSRDPDHDKGRGLLGLARLKVQVVTGQMRSPTPAGLASPARSQAVSSFGACQALNAASGHRWYVKFTLCISLAFSCLQTPWQPPNLLAILGSLATVAIMCM